MKKPTIELFLPLYNEEKIIEQHITQLFIELHKRKYSPFSIQITVVDDNSTDTSLSILKSLQKRYPLHVVHFSQGPSRRENLAKAMKQTQAQYVGFMDFDFATDIKHLPELISSVVDEQYDVATGSRYLSQSQVKREWYRVLLSKPYNWIVKYYLGSKIKDHQCGFKIFKTSKFKQLVQQARYDHSYTRGWFWDVEMLVLAQKKQYKVKEFPVKWVAGEKTSFQLLREIKLIPHLIRLRWK